MRSIILICLHFYAAISFSQECDSLPSTFYKLLKAPVHAGDSVVIQITNNSDKKLYYDKRLDKCYFECFNSNLSDSALGGKDCKLPGDNLTLYGELDPGEKIRIGVVLPGNGSYAFYFSTNLFSRPFNHRGRKHWRCIVLGFDLK